MRSFLCRQAGWVAFLLTVSPWAIGQNLVLNGDFTAGNTNFHSDYTFVPSGTGAAPGLYGVRGSSQSFNPAYASFNDHTSGSGQMMLVDGALGPIVWSQTVPVISNAGYQISAWSRSTSSSNQAVLRLLVNGTQLGPDFALSTASSWTNLAALWQSGTNTSATLAIVDVNPAPNDSGNDFALDDIAFTGLPDLSVASVGWAGVPTAGQSLTMTMSLTNIGSAAASGGWYHAFVLSTNNTTSGAVPGGVMEFYGGCCPTILPGSNLVVNLTASLPSVPSGNYYLIGVVDDRSLVYESNESNNTLAVPISIGVPDLAVASVTWSGLPTAGQSLSMSMIATNLGNGFANGGWYDAFVLSTNTTIAGAVPNGTMDFYGGCCPTILPGSNLVVNLTASLPSVPSGNYYLIGVVDDRSLVYESNESNNTLAVPISIGVPDLAVASVTWSGLPTAGQSLSMSMIATNLGNGFANGGWYDAFVLSTNNTIAGAVPNGTMDFYGGCCPTILPGSNLVFNLTTTLPSVPSGNYYLIGVVDNRSLVYESNESNNTLAVPISIGVPDLAVASVTWSGLPTAGQSLSMSMIATNLGNGFANGGWYDAFVLSTNTTIAGAVPNGTMDFYGGCCPTILPGSNLVFNLTTTLPSVPSGNYYLIGVVDNRSLVYESNESNNTLAVPISIGVPDLAVASVTWSGLPTAGQSLSMSMIATNLGNGFANGGWYDAFVLSTNTTIAGAVPNGTMDFYGGCCPTILPGSNLVFNLTTTLPSVASGNYYLIGVVDDRSLVYESNESNNTLAVPISIGVPDLAVASVTWSGIPSAGQSLSMSMIATNLGNGFANGGWYDAFVLSTNTTIAGAVPGGVMDFYGGCCPTILPGSNLVFNLTTTLPSVASGNYYLIGVVDDRSLVYESNESNNTLAVPIFIGVPDLAVASVTWSGTPTAGQGLAMSMVVTNLGNGSANGGWYHEFVLSTNTTIAGAVPNGVMEFYGGCCPTILPGSNLVVNLTATLPSVPSGNYYLIGVVDDRNLMYESNETNNALAIAMSVAITDLVATNLSAGTPIVAGTNLSASFTVYNASTNLYSGYWHDAFVLSTNATAAGAVGKWEYAGYYSLAPGNAYIQSRSFVLPPVAAGNYYLIAQADSRSEVAESTKTNNLQSLAIAVTNRPPSISLLAGPGGVVATSCVPVSVSLPAAVQTGSYAITNVLYFAGTNVIGSNTAAPYLLRTPYLEHGTYPVTAQAVDKFGLRATSDVALVSILWPQQPGVLLANLWSNNCVVCMTALPGSNYLVQTASNLTPPVAWSSLVRVTNLVDGSILSVTNARATGQLYYRTKLVP